jgi:hypothetical protein
MDQEEGVSVAPVERKGNAKATLGTTKTLNPEPQT